uniref:Uncharacterized protein n=1 Tax=Ananas comosus var. bracteatus TaxID=296719 RepID=A0A6V7QRP9_ANACO
MGPRHRSIPVTANGDEGGPSDRHKASFSSSGCCRRPARGGAGGLHVTPAYGAAAAGGLAAPPRQAAERRRRRRPRRVAGAGREGAARGGAGSTLRRWRRSDDAVRGGAGDDEGVGSGGGEGETLECAVCLMEFGDEGEALRLLPAAATSSTAIASTPGSSPTSPAPCAAPISPTPPSSPPPPPRADAAAAPDPAEVDVEMGNHRAPIAARSEHQRSRSAAEDRFTLRLPEHVRREIAHRRAASLSGCGGGGARRSVSVGVAGGGGGGGGEGETSGRGGGGCVSEFRDPRSDNSSFKRYARSITFAGFVLQGDVAARDWRPEVFQVSGSLRSATSLSQ